MHPKSFVRGAVLAAATLALAAPGFSASASGDARGAKAFLEHLYAHRSTSPAAEFDASMFALMKEDTRLAHGEVGALDWDPLCGCQDDSGMKAEITEVHLTRPGMATASVTLHWTLETPQREDHMTLDLSWGKSGWRVHDVHSKDEASLRDYMIKANAKARHHH